MDVIFFAEGLYELMIYFNLQRHQCTQVCMKYNKPRVFRYKDRNTHCIPGMWHFIMYMYCLYLQLFVGLSYLYFLCLFTYSGVGCFVVCLRFVSCVPNVANFSGLSIFLIVPSVFPSDYLP